MTKPRTFALEIFRTHPSIASEVINFHAADLDEAHKTRDGHLQGARNYRLTEVVEVAEGVYVAKKAE